LESGGMLNSKPNRSLYWINSNSSKINRSKHPIKDVKWKYDKFNETNRELNDGLLSFKEYYTQIIINCGGSRCWCSLMGMQLTWVGGELIYYASLNDEESWLPHMDWTYLL
jgi:hypothetical protein